MRLYRDLSAEEKLQEDHWHQEELLNTKLMAEMEMFFYDSLSPAQRKMETREELG
jgi:hypothetical protein